MPQLIPFYFLNTLFWGFLLIFISLVFFSQYLLPMLIRLYLSRLFILSL